MTDVVRSRQYYKARKSGNAGSSLSLDNLRSLLRNSFAYFEGAGYFVEAFGSECVDAGFEPGVAGIDVAAYVALVLHSADVWPIEECYASMEPDDIFSVVEFLYDHISKPLKKDWHSWNNCGWHYSNFDREAGQAEFRDRVNAALVRYGVGWELSESGEVLSLPPEGMKNLLDAPLPAADRTTADKVADAVRKFRRYGSSISDRTDAVRDLADVLEWLRPQIKDVLLKEDEADLFNLANNFGIRHMNQRQKLNYDKAVWLSWMFYHYLNTIFAFLHLTNRQRAKD